MKSTYSVWDSQEIFPIVEVIVRAESADDATRLAAEAMAGCQAEDLELDPDVFGDFLAGMVVQEHAGYISFPIRKPLTHKEGGGR